MWVEIKPDGYPVAMQLNPKPPKRGVAGWFARYEPPSHDPELELCSPVFPVPQFQDFVEFTVEPRELSGPELEAILNFAKEKAKLCIDVAAGKARQRYITDVPGQQGTYLLKEQQARDYLAVVGDAVPPGDLSPWPLIVKEAQATGLTYKAMAELVVQKAGEWMVVNSEIEAARIGGKAQVDAATSKAEIESVASQVVGGLDQI